MSDKISNAALHFSVGDIISIRTSPTSIQKYVILGRILYKDTHGYLWDEYKISLLGASVFDAQWLSIDEDECILWDSCDELEDFDDWELTAKGKETVVDAYNSVDVEPSDSAKYEEYYNEKTDKYYSVEIWDDEEENSEGVKIPVNLIRLIKKSAKKESSKKTKQTISIIISLVGMVMIPLISIITSYYENKIPSIEKILSKDSNFSNVTYITGSDKDKSQASVFQSTLFNKDLIVNQIINQRKGEVEVICNDSTYSNSISILTDKECCIIYTPQNDTNTYVHVASRNWTYENLEEPLYQADSLTQEFYRGQYENWAFTADSIGNPQKTRHRLYRSLYHRGMQSKKHQEYSSTIREQSRKRRSGSGSHGGGGK